VAVCKANSANACAQLGGRGRAPIIQYLMLVPHHCRGPDGELRAGRAATSWAAAVESYEDGLLLVRACDHALSLK
jgi:hypothetical protein